MKSILFFACMLMLFACSNTPEQPVKSAATIRYEQDSARLANEKQASDSVFDQKIKASMQEENKHLQNALNELASDSAL